MATMYPGRGTPLYRASSGSTREPVWLSAGHGDPTIPTTGSSIAISVTPGCQTDINVLFGTAPSGTAFTVMYDIQPDMSTEYVLSTVAAVALQKVYTFATQNVRLSGFIRITNAGGQDITGAWLQQTV